MKYWESVARDVCKYYANLVRGKGSNVKVALLVRFTSQADFEISRGSSQSRVYEILIFTRGSHYPNVCLRSADSRREMDDSDFTIFEFKTAIGESWEKKVTQIFQDFAEGLCLDELDLNRDHQKITFGAFIIELTSKELRQLAELPRD